MQILRDYDGRQIRLTGERIRHIEVEHRSVLEIPDGIAITLESPEVVRRSVRSRDVRLYYRWYTGTRYGDKYVCVVVVMLDDDAWIATAYLADRIKRGELIWESAR